jgi:hypothetical protein
MMRAYSTPLLAALMLAAAVSPAAAAPAHKAGAAAPGDLVTSDVRCLLTMAALGQDKQRQQAALIGAYFFAGRLSARAPGLDVPAAIKAQEAVMNPQQLPAEAQRCGPMVQAAMRALQTSFAPPAGAQPAPTPGATPAPAAPAPTPKAAPTPAPTPTPK